jgi:hypothetical protein
VYIFVYKLTHDIPSPKGFARITATFRRALPATTFHKHNMLSSSFALQRPITMAMDNQCSATESSGRRVLGDMSPNVRKVASTGIFSTNSDNKPMASSPLKRSFTASMEGTSGFKYIKRRKGSMENHVERSRERSSCGSKPVHEMFPPPQVSSGSISTRSHRHSTLIAFPLGVGYDPDVTHRGQHT